MHNLEISQTFEDGQEVVHIEGLPEDKDESLPIVDQIGKLLDDGHPINAVDATFGPVPAVDLSVPAGVQVLNHGVVNGLEVVDICFRPEFAAQGAHSCQAHKNIGFVLGEEGHQLLNGDTWVVRHATRDPAIVDETEEEKAVAEAAAGETLALQGRVPR